MRFSRSLAVLACMAIGASVGLYLTYEASSADSIGVNMDMREPDLGSLINQQDMTSIQEMDPAEYDAFVSSVMEHPAYLEAEALFASKGLLWDWLSAEAFIANVDGVPVRVFTAETYSNNGTYGVFVFARDEQGNHLISKMLTNIGHRSIEGGDPTISDIPVYVWSNGMPVYYVYTWQWIGGLWYPYYYWWHDSHNHPNWYYSYYNYWWWRYHWYGYYWAPWYNWYYAWWYWRFFNYWSTWFPY